MAEHVRIFEMSPRDGLQNESRAVSIADKIALVDLLSACGFDRIEVTSFVNPKAVPQMADAAPVMAGIRRAPGVRYSALAPNMRGFDAALAAGADEVAVFASASEGFSRANINCSIAESIDRFRPILAAAGKHRLPVRGYVSCAVVCPFDGPTPPAETARVAAILADAGCYEVSLGDTIGRATPETTAAMLDAVLDAVPPDRLAGHFHDTGGRALDNIALSLGRGLRCFDSSAGGLGGCPFAPGASGNVATEAVCAMLASEGYETGIDPDKLATAADFARSLRTD